MSLFDVSGRTAVVVGGTSSIGGPLAFGLAEARADVVATGRRVALVKEGPVKSVLVISNRDNVATALHTLEPGLRLELPGAVVAVQEAVPSGHKIALRTIRVGEAVIKYGSPIGFATSEIPAGAHVHTHNLASTRGRGDLELPRTEPQARLAEPPDDRIESERLGCERQP